LRQSQMDNQQEKKKLNARERIALLLDRDSFRELEPCGSDLSSYDNEGVITGRGTINGKPVLVFSQDSTIAGGSIGLNHGLKIAHVIESAVKEKRPVIGIYDSAGARITEGVNALVGCGEMIHQNVQASGVIPQIAVVLGPCAGAAAYLPAMSDFVFAVDGISQLYITGTKVIESVTGEKCDPENLGGAEMHASVSGVAHFLCENEQECFAEVRSLLSVLPSGNDEIQNHLAEGYLPKSVDIASIVPENERLTYSMPKLIEELFDAASFIEVHRHFARNIVVGFARLSGIPVGVVANNPSVKAGCLDIDSSDKAARFVRFCDAFSLPIVTFTDTPGYLPGVEEEHGGIIRHGAKLLFAYSEATSPKVTVIIRKAYGGAFIAMGSKQVGADCVYASPYAEMAVMGAESAVSILHHKEQEDSAENADELREKYIKEYREKYLNLQNAVKDGCVDEILEFKDIRKRLYDDIVKLKKTDQSSCGKKHANIPV